MDDPRSIQWLLSALREDLIANRGHWGGAGFQAVAVYRFGAWARRQKGLRQRVLTRLHKVLFALVRNLYSIELPRSTTIGRRLQIPHPAGIVVSYQAEIGDDCLIRQNATIGQFNRGRQRTPPYAPKLGNGVEVGAGATIVGGITIGNRARIGPNAVVMTDVPPGGAAFASPARIMEPLLQAKPEEADRATASEEDQ